MNNVVIEGTSVSLAVLAFSYFLWLDKKEDRHSSGTWHYLMAGLGLILLCGIGPLPERIFGLNSYPNSQNLIEILIVQLAGIVLGCSFLWLGYHERLDCNATLQQGKTSSPKSLQDSTSNVDQETFSPAIAPNLMNAIEQNSSVVLQVRQTPKLDDAIVTFSPPKELLVKNESSFLSAVYLHEVDELTTVVPQLELENFRTAVAAMPVPFAITRLSDGKILDINIHLSQLLNLPIDQLLGSQVSDYYFDLDNYQAALERVKQKQVLRDRSLQLKRSGNCPVWVIASFQLITFDREAVVLTVFQQHTQEQSLLSASGSLAGNSPSTSSLFRTTGNDAAVSIQAKAALQESEYRYYSLAALSPVGIFRTDMKGNYFYVNSRWCEISDLIPQEAMAAGWLNALHPDDRERVREQWHQALQKNLPFEAEYRFQRQDSSITWVMVQTAPERMSNGEISGYVGTVSDITAHRQAEIALRNRICQHAAVAQLSQSALAGTDLTLLMDEAVMLVTYALDVEYCNILELLPGGGTFLLRAGVGWQDGLVGQATMGTQPTYLAGYTLLAEEAVIVNDLRVETRFSGTPLLHNHRITSSISTKIQGQEQPFGLLGAYTTQSRNFSPDDIHFLQSIANLLTTAIERKQAEAQLHLLERAIAASRNGIAIVDAIQPDYPAIYVNPGFEQMTGYAASEATGHKCFSLKCPADTAQPDLERLEAALEEGRECHLISRSYRKDGTRFWNELHVSPVFSPNGNLTHFIGVHTDITERKQAEETLRLLESAVQQASEAIVVAAIAPEPGETKIVFANQAFTRMTGYTAAEAIGQSSDLVRGPKTNLEVFKRLRDDLAQGRLSEGESIEYRKDGTEFYAEIRCAPIRNLHGEITHYVSIQRDITERKQVEETLARQAFYDSLTHLPNRALLLDRLHQAVRRTKADSCYSFAVLFLDLDRFKLVNDSLGHAIGDRLLVEIAQRLGACTRSTDTVARLGGDEFAVLIEDVETIELANEIATRIHQELAHPFNLNGLEVFASASIGITLSNIGYDRPEDLLRDADTAMYRAKAFGQASHVIFNESMHDRAVVLLQLETDMRRAIQRQELRLHYQPIVSLITGRIVGFEALVRWQHPVRGTIAPGEFIPLAEETGLIVPIGWWVLHEACCQLKTWQQQFPNHSPLTISVNLSCKQFSQPNLLERIRQTLQQTDLPASSLHLEITESAIVEDANSASELLTQLRNLGIQICIDDFGTGYSSLSYLQQFPIDNLKVDRSFVNQMGNDSEAAEIVQAVVTLAHNLGMSVTAEGVETATQLVQLRNLQCEYGQGYLFSRPLNSDASGLLLKGLQQVSID